MARSFSATEVTLTLALLLVLAAFGAPALRRTSGCSFSARCANDLRQVGLAAVQYGDDKRYLPHVASNLKVLDGDIDSSDTPKAVRSLLWFGYHDNPEGFVCRASEDFSLPVDSAEVLENMRLWGFDRDYAAPDSPRNSAPPWQDPITRDPNLRETSELSFAYTRRGYNRNVSSLKTLGADRGLRVEEDSPEATLPGDRGNHREGWNVLKADCTVELVQGTPEHYEDLVGLGKTQAALPLSDRARPY